MTTLHPTETGTPFRVVADFEPRGDQPQAIDRLADGIRKGMRHQTLLGVTGSGKTYTMAKTVEAVQKPTLVIAPNKTLAAQLAQEFRDFFPENAVEYFVSYYDYYQPEAYVPSTDTYIEKEADINDEIDKLRHAATRSLMTRRDVLIVASVSCIYGLGSPAEYFAFVERITRGERLNRQKLARRLIEMQYERNDYDLARARFRVRGDTLEIMPAYEDVAVRVEFFGDDVERIVELDPLTGEILSERAQIDIYPAKHFVTSREKLEDAVVEIEQELDERLIGLREEGRVLEAQRLEHRTRYDLEMLRETGYCAGRRELLAAARQASARQHAVDADGLPAGRPPAHHRRVPHGRPATARHVPRRDVPQGRAHRLRLPPAVGTRQPPAQLRRVRALREPGGLRLRDSRRPTSCSTARRSWSR